MLVRPYVIRQGDYLTKLARLMGFDANEVWNHPKNQDLKSTRQDMDVLLPGDVIYIPEKRGPGLPFTPGVVNRYKAKIPTIAVSLVLRDGGEPLSNEPFVIEGLGAPREGCTDADGRVSFTAPMHVREVRLVFYERDVAYPVRIGDMDPIEEIDGVRKRLAHMGYYGWQTTGERHLGSGEEGDRPALVAFQRDHGLDPTGELDEKTRDAILKAHGR